MERWNSFINSLKTEITKFKLAIPSSSNELLIKFWYSYYIVGLIKMRLVEVGGGFVKNIDLEEN